MVISDLFALQGVLTDSLIICHKGVTENDQTTTTTGTRPALSRPSRPAHPLFVFLTCPSGFLWTPPIGPSRKRGMIRQTQMLSPRQ